MGARNRSRLRESMELSQEPGAEGSKSTARMVSAFTASVGTTVHNPCMAEPGSAGFSFVKPGAHLATAWIMAIEDLWYRNAIIYCLNVEKFMDANGDGVGDFEGLAARLPYLAGLGVT